MSSADQVLWLIRQERAQQAKEAARERLALAGEPGHGLVAGIRNWMRARSASRRTEGVRRPGLTTSR